MFGRERSRRAYQVYAEDEFLEAEDAGLEGSLLDGTPVNGWPEGASPNGSFSRQAPDRGSAASRLGDAGTTGADALDGRIRSGRSAASSYTAPRRRLSLAAGRSAGIALLAVVAMAVSALVAHTLLSGLATGGVARRPSVAALIPAAGMPASRSAPRPGGADSGRGSLARGGSVPAGRPAALKREKRSPRKHFAGSTQVTTRGASSTLPASGAPAQPQAVAPVASDTVAALGRPPGSPEFGFER